MGRHTGDIFNYFTYYTITFITNIYLTNNIFITILLGKNADNLFNYFICYIIITPVYQYCFEYLKN